MNFIMFNKNKTIRFNQVYNLCRIFPKGVKSQQDTLKYNIVAVTSKFVE